MHESEDSEYTIKVNKKNKHMKITETKVKLPQFRKIDYTQYSKNYIEHCCDYWPIPLSLDTDLS